MLGLIKDLDGVLTQLSLNTLTFRLTDDNQEVLIWTYLSI